MTTFMTEYKIVSSYSQSDLERRVNESIKQGWKVKGGVAPAFDGKDYWICQAIVRVNVEQPSSPSS